MLYFAQFNQGAIEKRTCFCARNDWGAEATAKGLTQEIEPNVCAEICLRCLTPEDAPHNYCSLTQSPCLCLLGRVLLCGRQRGQYPPVGGLCAPPWLRELLTLHALSIWGVAAPCQHPQEMAHQSRPQGEPWCRWRGRQSREGGVRVGEESLPIAASFPRWDSAKACGVTPLLRHPPIRRDGESKKSQNIRKTQVLFECIFYPVTYVISAFIPVKFVNLQVFLPCVLKDCGIFEISVKASEIKKQAKQSPRGQSGVTDVNEEYNCPTVKQRKAANS